MIWCCPQCHGDLLNHEQGLRCGDCARAYNVINSIPDLRLPFRTWVHFDDDVMLARELAAASALSVEELVRSVYARRLGWDADRINLRATQVMQGPERLEPEITEWLTPILDGDKAFLDLGCGSGVLLAAAHGHGQRGVGD